MEKEVIRNKKAQFYLIGAVIIVVAILGLSGATNYIRTKPAPVKFYDLSEEIDIESGWVVDYGIYNQEQIPTRIEDFTDNYFSTYAQEKEKDVELIFAYGDINLITVTTYKSDITGEVSVLYGTKSFTLQGKGLLVADRESFDPEGNNVIVNVLDRDYMFNLEKGENFFFVITKETKDETYVAQT